MKWMYYIQTIKPDCSIYEYRYDYNCEGIIFRKEYRGTYIEKYNKNSRKWEKPNDSWEFFKRVITGKNGVYHWRRVSEEEAILEFL